MNTHPEEPPTVSGSGSGHGGAPLRIGLVGAGAWGRNLLRNLDAMGVLAGVAEPSREVRERLASEHAGVRWFDDFGQLIDSRPDAVVLATPAPTHHAIARAALEAGADVFVEKPITLEPSEAEDLVALAAERGRILMVGHLLLYQPAIAWMKTFLDDGGLGRIFTLHQERLKLGRARRVENVLWSFGVHDVAVLLHLAGGMPTSVRSSGHCGVQPGVEDDVYLHLGFADGCVAHLHTSWLWPEMRRRLTVVGERGMLVYDEIAQTVTLHRKGIDAGLANVDEGEEIVFSGDGEPLRLELEHFAECVRERKPPRSDGRNGLAVVEVLARAAAAGGGNGS